MTRLFPDKTVDQQANSLASYLPGGRNFEAKNVEDTNLRNLLIGLAGEKSRVDTLMNDISEDHEITAATNFIEQWESAVGIPDECIGNTGTLEQRRNNVLLKLTKLNVQTVEDFIEVAELLGFENVEVFPLQDVAFPPYDVPFIPTSAPESRFIIVVKAENLILSVPPYDVPFTPGSALQSLLVCVFETIRPANVDFLFINVA